MKNCFATLVIGLLFSSANSYAADLDVFSAQCNGGQRCAMEIDNFEFQGETYNVQFAAGDFYQTYPGGAGWAFWNDRPNSELLADALLDALNGAGMAGVTDDVVNGRALSFSNGVLIPYSYFNQYVLYGVSVVYGGSPERWATGDGTASIVGSFTPRFNEVRVVPEPSIALMFVVAGALLIRRRQASCTARNFLPKYVWGSGRRS